MADPLNAHATSVPSLSRAALVLVDGRTFAISDEAGQIRAGTHGMVHDDLRHLSRFDLQLVDAELEVLASSTPTPLSAVVVARLVRTADPRVRAVMIRRRWIAGGLREDVHLRNTTADRQHWTLRLHAAADFAHVFDVKAGLAGTQQPVTAHADSWRIEDGLEAVTQLRFAPRPTFDPESATLVWSMSILPRQEAVVQITAEPVVAGIAAGLAFPIGLVPAEAIPMRRQASWQANVPQVVSSDPRLAPIVEQSLADIAALRIIDAGHAERAIVAAGAPWFMTVFGRDALLTSWMTLPFDPTLASGVLATLAELRGRQYDQVAEEQPGKIIHELRRHGGGGPFATRHRYYGSVDATPLFVMLAAEADRWAALSDTEVARLGPAVDAAVEWIFRDGDSNDDGFVDYQRSDPAGLSNQGWKDSWDGITYGDGTLPTGPIALAEVQGYTYAALLGAVQLSDRLELSRGTDELSERAVALRSVQRAVLG